MLGRAVSALLFRNAVAVGVVCRQVATGLSQRAMRRDQLSVASRATEQESEGKTLLCLKSKDDHGGVASTAVSASCGGRTRRESEGRPSRSKSKCHPRREFETRVRRKTQPQGGKKVAAAADVQSESPDREPDCGARKGVTAGSPMLRRSVSDRAKPHSPLKRSVIKSRVKEKDSRNNIAR